MSVIAISKCSPSFRLSCRLGRSVQSRSLATNAAEAAEKLMQRFQDRTVVRKQFIDGNQLQRLCLTLGRPKDASGVDMSLDAPPRGTPVPPGYHLVYFTPADLETALGPDGTDQTYNAPPPFTRRMWASGSLHWDSDNHLKVGDEVAEHTTLVKAEPKRSRDGSEMILVEVRKEFSNTKGRALIDRRSWLFRPPAVASPPPGTGAELLGAASDAFRTSAVRDLPSSKDGRLERHMRWSPVALFRFSALTFNAHMIHYNESWTRNVEGHPDVVVHGPLNLINMLDYWRDLHQDGRRLAGLAYRATAPIYAGQDYVIGGSAREPLPGQEESTLVSVTRDGTVCMRGEITSTCP